MIGQTERLLELKKLHEREQKKIKRGKIVAFSSGKGGTGKTFISVNTAYALSRLNKKVLIVDMDANLSNINIMLNMTAEKTLLNFYLKKNSLKDLVTVYEPNLHIIFGDSGKLNYPQLKESDIDYLLSALNEISEYYDFILLDISAGATDDIIHLLNGVDKNILITNPDPTAVMDAYVIIKLLHNKGNFDRKLVVVNKSQSNQDGMICFNNINKAATHFLKEELFLLGIVEADNSVIQSVMAQQLHLKLNPHGKTALQLIKLAQNFLKIMQLANNNQ